MNHGVLIIPLVLLVACFPKIDPSKVGRVEQNFDNIEPGMTKDEVRELVGEPIKEGTITYDYAIAIISLLRYSSNNERTNFANP
jgi:outer membrane protein assembly factor BamE (lipoprotein component of BamABCDE complex)